MTRPRTKNQNIRKITKMGRSFGLTLPAEFFAELGWREKQKVVVIKKGRHLLIKDWKA